MVNLGLGLGFGKRRGRMGKVKRHGIIGAVLAQPEVQRAIFSEVVKNMPRGKRRGKRHGWMDAIDLVGRVPGTFVRGATGGITGQR